MTPAPALAPKFSGRAGKTLSQPGLGPLETTFLWARGRKTRKAFGCFGCPRQTLFRVVDPGTIEGRLSGRPCDSADGLQVSEKV